MVASFLLQQAFNDKLLHEATDSKGFSITGDSLRPSDSTAELGASPLRHPVLPLASTGLV